MGQKVSPVGLRVGIIRNWDSRWYADKNEVADLLIEDAKIRKFINNFYKNAAVSKVIIERFKGTDKDKVKITIETAKPILVKGNDNETQKKVISKLAYMTKKDIIISVVDVKVPEIDAVLVAKNIASQLENRASFRRVQKIAIQKALKAGAKGARTLVSGRLGGAEMARCEGYSEGRVPLHTIRANVDYALAEASTTYGKLGVKVWIYRGEVLEKKKREEQHKKSDFKKTSKGGK